MEEVGLLITYLTHMLLEGIEQNTTKKNSPHIKISRIGDRIGSRWRGLHDPQLFPSAISQLLYLHNKLPANYSS